MKKLLYKRRCDFYTEENCITKEQYKEITGEDYPEPQA